MIACGIDPGLDGGVAIMTIPGRLEVHPTPVLMGGASGKRSFDVRGMRDLLSGKFSGDGMAVLEKVASRPGQGVSSVFRFGEGYGIWQGLLAGLDIPYQLVTPQAWKGEILKGTARDKQAAVEFIQRRFPNTSLLATPKSRVPHDGLAEAACMALYAELIHRLMYMGFRGG